MKPSPFLTSRRFRHVCPALLLALFAATCSSSSTGPSVPASLQIEGGNQTDSIGAVLRHPLSVTVLDATDRGVPGVRVRWWTVTDDAGDVTSAWTSTNADGTSTVQWRLGTVAGPQTAMAEVEGFGKVVFPATVRPGALVGILAAPRDTAIYVGAEYKLLARPVDRAGNTTADELEVNALRPDVARLSTQGFVHGESFGRAALALSAGLLRDTLHVSVVPEGTIVAYTYRGGMVTWPAATIVFGLDGTDYRAILSGPLGYNTRGARWIPGTDEIVFHERGPDIGLTPPIGLYVVDLEGRVRELANGLEGLTDMAGPNPDPDGGWIYFTGIVSQQAELWRIRLDGTGAERLSGENGPFRHDMAPSPSPDGMRLAFQTNMGVNDAAVIRILDLASRTEQPIDIPGTKPRWAPVGEEIAFLVDDEVRVVRADGTGETVIVGMRPGMVAGDQDSRNGTVAWSPDAQWLLVCRYGVYGHNRYLAIIHRATREILPLSFTADWPLCEADWRI